MGHCRERQVADRERAREQVTYPDRGGLGVDERLRPGLFEQQLPAASARRQELAVPVGHTDSDQATTAVAVQLRHETALRTERQPERRALDIAAAEDQPAVVQPSCTDMQSAVWRVCALCDLCCGAAKPRPIDGVHISTLSRGGAGP